MPFLNAMFPTDKAINMLSVICKDGIKEEIYPKIAFKRRQRGQKEYFDLKRKKWENLKRKSFSVFTG